MLTVQKQHLNAQVDANFTLLLSSDGAIDSAVSKQQAPDCWKSPENSTRAQKAKQSSPSFLVTATLFLIEHQYHRLCLARGSNREGHRGVCVGNPKKPGLGIKNVSFCYFAEKYRVVCKIPQLGRRRS